ncbi:hypothetical protein [Actinomadura sp. DC4]|nr:hypothetical protein [Actinomadura sp. DC4]
MTARRRSAGRWRRAAPIDAALDHSFEQSFRFSGLACLIGICAAVAV